MDLGVTGPALCCSFSSFPTGPRWRYWGTPPPLVSYWLMGFLRGQSGSKLRLNLKKMEALLVGSSSVLESGYTLKLSIVLHSLLRHLFSSLGVLLDGKVAAVERSTYYQL